MKSTLVKELMLPLSAYATVSRDATLGQAVLALKDSQKSLDPNRHRHRAILVCDDQNNVVGKVSMFAILRSLEPKYDEMLSDKGMMHVGFTLKYQREMIDQLNLYKDPLVHLCQKAAQMKVSAFMEIPGETDYIKANETLNHAIHLMVMGLKQSLLVTEDKKVIGILRMTDVCEAVMAGIAACEI